MVVLQYAAVGAPSTSRPHTGIRLSASSQKKLRPSGTLAPVEQEHWPRWNRNTGLGGTGTLIASENWFGSQISIVTQGRHIGAPINQRADPLASQGVNNPRVLSLIIRTVDMVNQYIHKRSLVMLKQKKHNQYKISQCSKLHDIDRIFIVRICTLFELPSMPAQWELK